MKKLLLASTLLAAIGATSAHAANTALILWNASDPGGFEAATGTGSAAVATSNLDGITITLSKVSRGINPNDLTEGNIDIANTTGVEQTLRIIAGANGFLSTASGFTLTGAVGGTLGTYDLMGSYFVDAGNSLNGQTTSITGLDIGDFDSGLLVGPHSFAFNGFGADLVHGPYGLAESLTLTLQPGASVFVQGVSMDASAVPEASTWLMGLAGFGFVGALALRKGRKNRLSLA